MLHLRDQIRAISTSSSDLMNWNLIQTALTINLLGLKDINDAKSYLLDFGVQLAEIGYKPKLDFIDRKIKIVGHHISRINLSAEDVPKEYIKELINLLDSDFIHIVVSAYQNKLENKDQFEKLFTITEAANHLGVSQKTIRNYIKDGKLEYQRDMNNRMRIPQSSIDRFKKG